MGKPTETIQAKLLADLSAELADCADHPAFGVGCDGRVWVAGLLSDEALREDKGLGSFPKSKLTDAAIHRVVLIADGGKKTLELSPVNVPAHYVQGTPGGLLLAGARCNWRESGIDQNAILFGDDGSVRQSFVLGDGIQDLRVTPNGSIWVSYFDEGVFGNYGWGSPGPAPIGAAGLVAFTPDGEKRFEFDAEAAGADAICDAYATNARWDDDVWVHYYTDFPIVHIHQGRYTVWATDVGGASALAVREPNVLLFGDYKRASRGRIVELADGSSKVKRVVDLVDDRGEPIAASAARGVGDRLYLLQGSRIWGVFDW